MRVLSQPWIACGVLVIIQRTPISSAAIQHHTSRVRSLVNRRAATTGRDAARSGGDGRRELSAEAQLDILRLGFIPTSHDDDEYGECKPRRNNAVRGGGSFDDNSASRRRRSNKAASCRELTAQEQLDILRLGFIPISRDEEEPKARGLMRFIPRGGSIESAPQQQHCGELSAEEQLDILRLGFIPPTCSTSDDDDEESKTYSLTRLIGLRGGSIESTPQPQQYCRRELSAEEQLDILRLGFIPPSSPSHTRYYTYNPRFSRGGSIDEASSVVSKERRTIHPLAFASIMAGLAGCSDVICLQKFNCYATMMTGNVITLSLAISEQQLKDVLWRMSLIGSYVIGAASVRCIELLYQESLSQNTKSSKQHIRVAVAPMIATVFAIANQLITKDIGQRYNVAMLALGYGMVYSTANQVVSTITQLLTNHITKLGTLMGTTLSTRKTSSWNSEASKSVCIIGSFIIGGIFGGHLLQVISTDFPFFTLLGLVYALVLAFC